jgi:hypothetical protein
VSSKPPRKRGKLVFISSLESRKLAIQHLNQILDIDVDRNRSIAGDMDNTSTTTEDKGESNRSQYLAQGGTTSLLISLQESLKTVNNGLKKTRLPPIMM